MTLKIELQTAELDRALTRLAASINDMTPIMRAIGGELEAATERSFDDEGARIGARWKPSRRALEQKGQTLRDTGRLIDSISAGGAGHVSEVTPQSVFVGTNVEYAAIHQFGGEIKQAAQSRKQAFRIDKRTKQKRFAKRGTGTDQWTSRGAYTITITPRPYFGLNAQDEQDIAEKIAELLDASLK